MAALFGGFVMKCVVPIVAGLLILGRTSQFHLSAAEGPGEGALHKWQNAVETYVSVREDQKAIVIRSLEKLIDAAKVDNDASLALELEQEKDKFQSDASLPWSVSTAAYDKKLAAAQKVLTAAGQKTIEALQRIKLAAEAAKVRQELESLTANPPNDNRTPARIVKGRDPRVAWVTPNGRCRFQLLKSNEWMQTLPTQTNFWTEISRTDKFIELHDTKRKFGIRLMETESLIDYNYDPKIAPAFGRNDPGGWYDPSDPAAANDAKSQ